MELPTTETKPAETASTAAAVGMGRFLSFAGSAGVVAVGVELLTNEAEKKMREAEWDLNKQSGAKLGLAAVKGIAGYYAVDKMGHWSTSGSGALWTGAGVGLFVSAVADVVEVIGWQMDKA